MYKAYGIIRNKWNIFIYTIGCIMANEQISSSNKINFLLIQFCYVVVVHDVFFGLKENFFIWSSRFFLIFQIQVLQFQSLDKFIVPNLIECLIIPKSILNAIKRESRVHIVSENVEKIIIISPLNECGGRYGWAEGGWVGKKMKAERARET